MPDRLWIICWPVSRICLVLVISHAATLAWALQSGSGSPAARQDAIRAIPLEQLSPAARTKVSAVIQDSSFFRRLPVCVIRCDPEFYLFIVRHPDIIVAIWHIMGLTEIDLEEIGPGKFRYRDSDGTSGVVEYLYSSHDTHVIYTEATYEGPLFNRLVRSKAVILLKSGYVLETDGYYYITSRLDAFVSVDKAAWEALTKTLHPLVGKIADSNFTQTNQFVALLYETVCRNPDGVTRMAAKLRQLRPEVQKDFTTLVAQVAERARQIEERSAAAVAERPNFQPRK